MASERGVTEGTVRRQVLRALAGGTAAAALPGVVSAGGDSPTSDRTFYVAQGHERFEVTPIKGEESPEEFYDWGRYSYSSEGTVALQRPDTSVAFLYEDADGEVYLVVVHGKYEPHDADWDGGSVTFEFLGLSRDGEWLVQDDRYDGPQNYDRWETDGYYQTVDWTWAGGRTDGGLYGPLGKDPYFRIEPGFNDRAALYGTYYSGDVTEWQFLSGARGHPDRHALDLHEPVHVFQNPYENRDHGDWWDEKKKEWQDEREEWRDEWKEKKKEWKRKWEEEKEERKDERKEWKEERDEKEEWKEERDEKEEWKDERKDRKEEREEKGEQASGEHRGKGRKRGRGGETGTRGEDDDWGGDSAWGDAEDEGDDDDDDEEDWWD